MTQRGFRYFLGASQGVPRDSESSRCFREIQVFQECYEVYVRFRGFKEFKGFQGVPWVFQRISVFFREFQGF